jgi:hypothetical protein
LNFSKQTSLVKVYIWGKFEIKIRRFDFSANLDTTEISWAVYYIENLIIQPDLDDNPNPFRVFTRTACSIYKQKAIEIEREHLGRFRRERLDFFE